MPPLNEVFWLALQLSVERAHKTHPSHILCHLGQRDKQSNLGGKIMKALEKRKDICAMADVWKHAFKAP